MRRLLLLAICLVILCGCGSEPTPTQVVQQVVVTVEIAATPLPPTDTPESTDTPEPTKTPEPTHTPEPTNTPKPTNTPRPTSTPRPTNTPTATPAPVSLSGNGQYATDPIMLPEVISIVSLAHSGERNFIVKAYSGDEEELLVNTIGGYKGSRPIGLDSPVSFDIQADGAWTLEIEPIWFTDSAKFSGKGDSVSGIFDPPAQGAWNVSHDGVHNFIVKVHCSGGSDLIENTIGPVSGSTIIGFPDGPCFWQVQAVGKWSLEPRN